MKKKVLLTGASGFLGGHLIQSLSSNFEFEEVSHEEIYQQIPSVKGETIIHLAGISSVPECDKNPLAAYQSNCAMTMSLAESFFKTNPGGHFTFASTGQVYSDENQVPYTENSALKPLSIYSRTKLVAEDGLRTLAKALNGRLTILRLFNQTHKTQSPHFFLPSIYQQLLKSNDRHVQIQVGNIDLNRDLSSVQDFTSAMEALLTKPAPNELQCFNLCSGNPKNLREIALNLAKRLQKEITFEVDASRIRAADRKELYGSSELFQKTYGWKSKSQSVDEFLDGFLKDS